MTADGIVLETGGSRGIGAAMATLLAQQAYGGLRETSKA
jgi:NAD(P)-dependent dehydrogenase (short-subunit alcohol dehydrogenase family)